MTAEIPKIVSDKVEKERLYGRMRTATDTMNIGMLRRDWPQAREGAEELAKVFREFELMEIQMRQEGGA